MGDSISFIVSLSLMSLAGLSFRASRSWLFPPALFPLYWAAIVGMSAVFRVGGYALASDALLVFFSGSLVFTAGGWVAVRSLGTVRGVRKLDQPRKRFVQGFIAVFSAGLLALAPFFALAIYKAGVLLDIEVLPIAARTVLGETTRGGIPRYYLSLTSVGIVLAFVAAWLYDGSRRDGGILILAVLGPLLLSVLTFARSPVYALLIGVLAVTAFRGTVRLRIAIVVLAAGAVLTVAMGGMLGKGPLFGAGGSPVRAVAENLAVFFLGGPAGFAQVMGNPAAVGEHGLSLRFFTQLARSIGADVDMPENVLGYFSEDLGNVYTIYFAYWLDGGWWGVLGMSFLAGFLCTAVYVMARRGSPTAGAALGLTTASILNSAVGDGIFGSSVPWLLILAVVGILWSLPTVSFHFFRRITASSASGYSKE